MELDLKEKRLDEVVGGSGSTFYTVYRLYWTHRFGESAAKELKKTSQAAMRSAWKQMESVWYKTLDEVTIIELQEIVNNTARSYSKTTVTRLLCLIKGLYKFAVPRELCRKESGMYVETPKVKEEEHHEAFTDEEIEKLWRAASSIPVSLESDAFEHKLDGDAKECVAAEDGTVKGETCCVDIAETARMILIMIYSRYRIGAWSAHDVYDGMKVDLENMVFMGGVKTEAGKNRVVPIHSCIQSLVAGMKVSTADGERFCFLCGKSESQFRRDMKVTLEKIGVRQLTPHSCRHTFHRLLERAGVYEADRKRLMSHSLKGDVTNGVYGHRGIEELRECIEMIKVDELNAALNVEP